jgi:hypothetical protein
MRTLLTYKTHVGKKQNKCLFFYMTKLFRAFENYKDSTQGTWTATMYIPSRLAIRDCYFDHILLCQLNVDTSSHQI